MNYFFIYHKNMFRLFRCENEHKIYNLRKCLLPLLKTFTKFSCNYLQNDDSSQTKIFQRNFAGI